MGKNNTKVKKEDDLLGFILILLALRLLLSIALGTPLPLIVVMSHSMTHDALAAKNFLPWLLANGFNSTEIATMPYQNGLNKGDIAVVCGRCALNLGDVVVYRAPNGLVIVHRLVGKTEDGYITKGDRNPAPDPWAVKPEWIYGKVILRIPLIGWPRVLLTEAFMKTLGVVI